MLAKTVGEVGRRTPVTASGKHGYNIKGGGIYCVRDLIFSYLDIIYSRNTNCFLLLRNAGSESSKCRWYFFYFLKKDKEKRIQARGKGLRQFSARDLSTYL